LAQSPASSKLPAKMAMKESQIPERYPISEKREQAIVYDGKSSSFD
jgi:hypothetical protein